MSCTSCCHASTFALATSGVVGAQRWARHLSGLSEARCSGDPTPTTPATCPADGDGDGRQDTLLGLRLRHEGVTVLRSRDHVCGTVPPVAREALDDGIWQAGATDEEGRLLLIREAAKTIHLMRFVYDGARGAFAEDGRTPLWSQELRDEAREVLLGTGELMGQIALLPAYPSPLLVRTRPGLIGVFRPSWADGQATLFPLLSITSRVPEHRPEPLPSPSCPASPATA
jgi:hypothetical protein